MTALINSLPFLLTILTVKIFQRLGLVKEKYKTALADVLINIVAPALIILLIQNTEISFSELKLFLMALVAWLIMGIAGLTYVKVFEFPRKKAGAILVCLLSFSIGIVGYPLISLNYSSEVFAKVILYDIIGHFLLLMTLTYAVAIYYGQTKKADFGTNIKQILCSPIIISMLIGVLMSLTKFRSELFTNLLEYISSSFGLIVAALLALSLKMPKKKGLFQLSSMTLFKLISGIMIGFLVTAIFGFTGDIRKGLIVATATPVSVMALVFAETEGLDTELAGQFISASLLLSLFALPILIAFI